MSENSGGSKGCVIQGIYIDPETCMKIIDHKLRREILHQLYLQTIRGPVSKRMLAEALHLDYYELIYQLNNHLKDFWQVRYEVKKRGTHEEFISPPESNAVYIMLSSGAIINVLDPLANLYGQLSDTGTRCQQCSNTQMEKCLDQIREQSCFHFCREENQKMTKMLEMNNRATPFTPVDLIIACTALRSLEGQGCIVNLGRTRCEFLRKMEAHKQFV
jgi:hypothetical protein